MSACNLLQTDANVSKSLSYYNWCIDECLGTDIAIIIQFSYQGNVAPTDKDRQDLAMICETVRQAALGEDLVRPIVGIVVESEETARKVLFKWAADQDWHQGRFSLYVVDQVALNDTKNQNNISNLRTYAGRKQDLLSPELPQLAAVDADKLALTAHWNRIVKSLPPPSDDLKKLLDPLNVLYRDNGGGFNKRDLHSVVTTWADVTVVFQPNDDADSTPAEPVTGPHILARVNRLTVKGFRGVPRSMPVIVPSNNAPSSTKTKLGDIVLIVAANGFGKSTLLEALCLALTRGCFFKEDKQAALFHRDSQSRSDGRLEFEIQVDGDRYLRDTPSNLDPITVTLNAEEATEQAFTYKWTRLLTIRDTSLTPNLPGFPSLDARLASYFQDRLDQLFDETTSGKTLRDILEPNPSQIIALENLLEVVIGEMTTRQEREQKKLSQYADNPQVQRDWESFLNDHLWELLKEARELKLDLPVFNVDSPAAQAPDTSPKPPPTLLGASIPADLQIRPEAMSEKPREFLQLVQSTAQQMLKQEVETHLKQQVGDWETRRNELEALRETLRTKLDELETADVEGPLLTAGQNVLDGILFLHEKQQTMEKFIALTALRQALVAVVKDETTAALQPIRVRIEALRTLHSEVQRLQWQIEKIESTFPKSDLAIRLKALIKEAKSLENDHKPWTIAIEAYLVAQRRTEIEAVIEALESKIQAAKDVQEGIKSRGKSSDPPWFTELHTAFNTVASRFHFAGKEFWPLKFTATSENVDKAVRLRSEIHTGDGREVAMLSTGQRGQLGVSFMVAQNQIMTDHIGHRVLLLDDVTTAYDLTNIAREAVVWRQLAYGYTPEKPWPSSRRQLFICSHHDDMSNHLIDLLIPPEGKSMTVLRIEDWKPDPGPEIARYDVQPTRPMPTPKSDGSVDPKAAEHDRARKRMAQHIREVLR